MEELIEKIENLKQALNQTEQVRLFLDEKEKVMKNTELLENIKKYQETQDEQLKEKILQDPDFRSYKHQETECNLLIFAINQKLKKSFGKDKGCL